MTPLRKLTFMTPPRALIILGITVGGLVFLAVGATGWVDPERYGSLTAGAQALGVVIALALAAFTLRSDSRDRRVDRVLALHNEFMTGGVWEARHRLAHHLHALEGPRESRVTREAVFGDHPLLHYAEDVGAPLKIDVDLLLRFFERANAARLTGALHEDLLADLIGKHAMWWDHAFAPDEEWMLRAPLQDLSSWCHGYVESRILAQSRLREWLRPLQRDFEDPRPYSID
jgi:hypothetical protein